MLLEEIWPRNLLNPVEYETDSQKDILCIFVHCVQMYTVLYILITVQYVHGKHTSELRVSIIYRLQIELVYVFRKWLRLH